MALILIRKNLPDSVYAGLISYPIEICQLARKLKAGSTEPVSG
jgi:hypothetical protein